MSEQPLQLAHATLKRLHAYWLEKKGERIAPPRSAIKPDEVVDLLPDISIVEVVGDPPRFRSRLVGTRIVAAFGRESTGRFLDEVDYADIKPEVFERLNAAVAERRPNVRRSAFTTADGRRLEYESVILPLSADGEAIDMLLIGVAVERAYQDRMPDK
jgi:hypothetical protein